MHTFPGAGGADSNLALEVSLIWIVRVFLVHFGAIWLFLVLVLFFQTCNESGPAAPTARCALCLCLFIAPSGRLTLGWLRTAELPGVCPCPQEHSALPGNMPLGLRKSGFPPTHPERRSRECGPASLAPSLPGPQHLPAPGLPAGVDFTQMNGAFLWELKITPATQSSLKRFFNCPCPQFHFS